MIIFKQVADLQHFITQKRRSAKKIGFVPTMGALHSGHLELVKIAQNSTQIVVASIFVNPTQFNDPADLAKYPRMPGKDALALESAGCHVLFMPPVEEVYPPGLDVTLNLDFGQLEHVMEGAFRPGHFDGMATVVNRLLQIVRPHQLFMGQKDYQQLTIVRNMLKQLKSKIELVLCATVREEDGLAKSSRNMRLTPEMRQTAPIIYRTILQGIELFKNGKSGDEVANFGLQQLTQAGLRPEYFTLSDGITLQPLQKYNKKGLKVLCTAAWAGDVRLIDNVVFDE